MSKIIEQYYKQANIMPLLLKQKMEKFQRNEDIMKEFEYWIENHQYKSNGCISIEGYNAKDLAALSDFLDGEGAFILLIELREQPEKAKARILKGFVLK